MYPASRKVGFMGGATLCSDGQPTGYIIVNKIINELLITHLLEIGLRPNYWFAWGTFPLRSKVSHLKDMLHKNLDIWIVKSQHPLNSLRPSDAYMRQ